jgi:hypothetical protein
MTDDSKISKWRQQWKDPIFRGCVALGITIFISIISWWIFNFMGFLPPLPVIQTNFLLWLAGIFGTTIAVAILLVAVTPTSRQRRHLTRIQEERKEIKNYEVCFGYDVNADQDLDDIEELQQYLDTDDVAQKRYLMFHIFEKLIDARLSIENTELEITEKISELKQIDGYMYKLSQDFLTSSSTMKKENKLEKIIEHIERKES